LRKLVIKKAAISLFFSDENKEVSSVFEQSLAGTSGQ